MGRLTRKPGLISILIVCLSFASFPADATICCGFSSSGGSGASGPTGPSGPSGPSGPAGTASFDCQTWTMWVPEDKDAAGAAWTAVAAPSSVSLGCIADMNKTWPASLTDVGQHVPVDFDYYTHCGVVYFGKASAAAGTFGVSLRDYSNAANLISEITWNSGDSSGCSSRGSSAATDLTASTGKILVGIQLRNQTAATSDIGLSSITLRCCTGDFTP